MHWREIEKEKNEKNGKWIGRRGIEEGREKEGQSRKSKEKGK